jgi:hypothetical protein
VARFRDEFCKTRRVCKRKPEIRLERGDF